MSNPRKPVDAASSLKKMALGALLAGFSEGGVLDGHQQLGGGLPIAYLNEHGREWLTARAKARRTNKPIRTSPEKLRWYLKGFSRGRTIGIAEGTSDAFLLDEFYDKEAIIAARNEPLTDRRRLELKLKLLSSSTT